ncbi:MAG: hypothetical protein JWN70_5725 [Planctomycetaceae bacterium]|nr:hypothetical protein [Planctomycetaceae bacterium]
MPHFVVLTHDHPTWHWDFMLESAGVLRTWRLDQQPNQTIPIRATPLPDHRLVYLEYEGPVSGQRGQVQRWDQGEYELLNENDGNLTATLHGTRLRGQVSLELGSDDVVWFRFTMGPGQD